MVHLVLRPIIFCQNRKPKTRQKRANFDENLASATKYLEHRLLGLGVKILTSHPFYNFNSASITTPSEAIMTVWTFLTSTPRV